MSMKEQRVLDILSKARAKSEELGLTTTTAIVERD